MGHASKQMVYEMYGNYVEGLEEVAEAIYHYLDQGFITILKKRKPDTAWKQYRAQSRNQFY